MFPRVLPCICNQYFLCKYVDEVGYVLPTYLLTNSYTVHTIEFNFRYLNFDMDCNIPFDSENINKFILSKNSLWFSVASFCKIFEEK